MYDTALNLGCLTGRSRGDFIEDGLRGALQHVRGNPRTLICKVHVSLRASASAFIAHEVSLEASAGHNST